MRLEQAGLVTDLGNEGFANAASADGDLKLLVRATRLGQPDDRCDCRKRPDTEPARAHAVSGLLSRSFLAEGVKDARHALMLETRAHGLWLRPDERSNVLTILFYSRAGKTASSASPAKRMRPASRLDLNTVRQLSGSSTLSRAICQTRWAAKAMIPSAKISLAPALHPATAISMTARP